MTTSPMLVVSDTSPLLNLAKVDRLDLVRQQLNVVLIPPAVHAELRVDADLPGSATIRSAMAAGWLRVEEVLESDLSRVLRRELDRGEAEAIVLAAQRRADLLLVDEREARRVARALGMKVTGAVGILLRARLEGSLSSLSEALADLHERAGFRLDSELVSEVLRLAGESGAATDRD